MTYVVGKGEDRGHHWPVRVVLNEGGYRERPLGGVVAWFAAMVASMAAGDEVGHR